MYIYTCYIIVFLVDSYNCVVLLHILFAMLSIHIVNQSIHNSLSYLECVTTCKHAHAQAQQQLICAMFLECASMLALTAIHRAQ